MEKGRRAGRREREEEANRRMNRLEERISERLEAVFGEATRVEGAQKERLETIAAWLAIKLEKEGRRVDKEEAHEVWRNVASMASGELLRTALALTERPGVRSLGVAVEAQRLAEATWERIDQDRFVHLTGVGTEKSQKALQLAARECVVWARDGEVRLTQDGVDFWLGAQGEGLAVKREK